MLLSAMKTILGVSKSVPIYISPRISTASLSTAYERAEGSNAVAEAGGSSDDGAKREDMHEVKEEHMNNNDAAKDGPIKAVEGADMVRGTAKDSMDGAWIASQETSDKLRDYDKNQGLREELICNTMLKDTYMVAS